MKRINKSLSVDVKPKKLHYEDLKAIADILEEADPDELTIKTNEYQLDSIEEILALKQDNLVSIELNIRNPYFSIDMSSNKIRLYASSDTLITKGLILKVKEYLDNLPNDYSKGYQYIFEYTRDISTATLLSLLTIGKANVNSDNFILFPLFYLLVSIGWFLYHNYFPQSPQPLRIPQRVNESFWSKNKDTLLVGILVAVFGVILTFVLDQIKK